jgi:hypothetical protein
MAALVFVSGALLVYTSFLLPFQIFMWDYSDPCNKFPTLFFDCFIDTFFMVRPSGNRPGVFDAGLVAKPVSPLTSHMLLRLRFRALSCSCGLGLNALPSGDR